MFLILQPSTLSLQTLIPPLAAYIFLQNTPIFTTPIKSSHWKPTISINVALVEPVEAPTKRKNEQKNSPPKNFNAIFCQLISIDRHFSHQLFFIFYKPFSSLANFCSVSISPSTHIFEKSLTMYRVVVHTHIIFAPKLSLQKIFDKTLSAFVTTLQKFHYLCIS